MKSHAFAGLALLSILVHGAGAVVLNVPDEYASIQKGIEAAVNGDTVLVAPGLYFERIDFLGKNITVTSTDPNDPGIVGYTIINGQKQGSVVAFKGTETSRAMLTGFTITGGTGTVTQSSTTSKYFYGGGIYCSYASATITHNVIASNVMPYKVEQTATGAGGAVAGGAGRGGVASYAEYSHGGGIYATGSPTITYNVICRNAAYRGGGVYCYGGTICNNLVYDNSGCQGGGIYCSSNYGRLTNNTIVSNDISLNPEAGYGGNMYVYLGYDSSSSITVANNIISGADSGGGVYWSGYVKAGKMFRYNNVWGNAPYDYVTPDQRTGVLITDSNAAWTGHNGNISADPHFIADWSKRYRLDEASPCISAGDPNFAFLSQETDIDGEDRVYGLRVDIGADEYIGYVKPIAEAGRAQHVLAPQPVTLDGSGSYFSDPVAAAYHWTQTQGTPVQLDDPNSARPTFTPLEKGWYVFQLTVGDNQYASGPDQVLVVVGNERPVADAGPDRLLNSPGEVTLDGSGSHDADPTDLLAYSWKQVEGPAVHLYSWDPGYAWFTSDKPGIYVFELVVSDGFTTSEPDTVKIETTSITSNIQVLPATVRSSTIPGYYYYPAVAGTAVVYAGAETTSIPSSWSIFRNDPRTGEVLKYDAGTIDTKPEVDGDITVWMGGSGSYSSRICTSLCAASVTTGTTVTRLQNATSTTSYGYPAISGRTVVYLRHTGVDTNSDQYLNTSYDICGTDISDFAHPVHFTIAAKAGHGIPYPYNDYSYAMEDYVDVSGNIVVWESDGDIYGADISDRSHIRIFPICTAPGRQYDPAISGHTVFWTDERNDLGDIYGADISDPNNVREFEVCVEPGWQGQMDVDGSLMVFLDGSESSGYLRLCGLTREYGWMEISTQSLQNGDFYGNSPSVHGSMIAWRDSRRSSQISCARIDIAYALTHGPVQNVTTGARYDYVQHAIASASDGDVIVVPPGTYDERIRFGGKNVTVRSTDPQDPDVRGATIFKGDGQLVTFADGETSACLFTGFTVTGGSYGIHCDSASPTITLCNVTGNRDAGMKVWALAQPLVSRCDVTGNGIGVEMSTEMVIRTAGYAAPSLQNCLIVGNRTYGVYGGEPVITNCTVADNGSLGVSGVKPKVNDSIVYFNNTGGLNVKGKTSLTVNYSDIQGGSAGQGNIDVDPRFAMRGFWMNRIGLVVSPAQADPNSVWISGDYHLASQGWRWSPAQQTWVWDDHTSPCIDAGDPAMPIGDEKACGPEDPLSERAGPNTRINMGAYGGTSEASLAPKP
jgi:beta propeller repeat protein